MASEPPAPDLGATRERMDPLIETLAFLIGNSAALDLKALLTAYDAQAARLATFQEAYQAVKAKLAEEEAIADAQAAQLAAVTAERDQQTALVRRWDERDHEKTVQLARSAALEQAARAWDENHGGDHDCAACQELQRALAAPLRESP